MAEEEKRDYNDRILFTKFSKMHSALHRESALVYSRIELEKKVVGVFTHGWYCPCDITGINMPVIVVLCTLIQDRMPRSRWLLQGFHCCQPSGIGIQSMVT